MSLSKDQILKSDDIEVRDVDVPEWGGSVRLRALTGAARDAWEASLVATRQVGNMTLTTRDTANMRAKLVGQAVIDDAGNRMFADNEINALGQKSATVLDRLFNLVAEMSGLSPEAVEEAGKDSETDPSDASTSNSPENSDPQSPDS